MCIVREHEVELCHQLCRLLHPCFQLSFELHQLPLCLTLGEIDHIVIHGGNLQQPDITCKEKAGSQSSIHPPSHALPKVPSLHTCIPKLVTTPTLSMYVHIVGEYVVCGQYVADYSTTECRTFSVLYAADEGLRAETSCIQLLNNLLRIAFMRV